MIAEFLCMYFMREVLPLIAAAAAVLSLLLGLIKPALVLPRFVFPHRFNVAIVYLPLIVLASYFCWGGTLFGFTVQPDASDRLDWSWQAGFEDAAITVHGDGRVYLAAGSENRMRRVAATQGDTFAPALTLSAAETRRFIQDMIDANVFSLYNAPDLFGFENASVTTIGASVDGRKLRVEYHQQSPPARIIEIFARLPRPRGQRYGLPGD